jgi:hypothetical protein
MFRDLFAAEPDWQIILLRYFNPVGAHASGDFNLQSARLWRSFHFVSAETSAEIYDTPMLDSWRTTPFAQRQKGCKVWPG